MVGLPTRTKIAPPSATPPSPPVVAVKTAAPPPPPIALLWVKSLSVTLSVPLSM
jgi:hypothetical protein